ncbi:hypothetical protein DID77_02045 [Candidatus Marinamargulisbacteria bacterium SCGC AG-439-L15]|nr:hypothetical protein DID77_02045 [Candidatus Marinamargulisbacteria bacterium SCGC AG-439-L15]
MFFLYKRVSNTATEVSISSGGGAAAVETAAVEMSVSKDVLEKRDALIDLLKAYFKIDSNGYIVSPISGKDLGDLNNNKDLSRLFFEISRSGDAAYCHDIRVTLAGYNVSSDQVKKGTKEVVSDTTRPVSFTLYPDRGGTDDPSEFGNKKKPAYIDAFANAIYRGYKDFRYKTQGVVKTASKKKDKGHTNEQLLDYQRRCELVRERHKEGLLLGRVANLREVRDFAGHRYNMGNDILSTTLWPREGSPLEIKLFCEYGTDTVGLLLDTRRVGSENFGRGFKQNAVTVGSGFRHNKKTWVRGAKTIEGQKELFRAYETGISDGQKLTDLIAGTKILADQSGFSVTMGKTDARSGARRRFMSADESESPNTIYWNEQTVYRGIESDILLGLFVKADSDSFAKSLKDMVLLQERLRRKKGIYVPIFQFKGKTNELEAIHPDALLLSIIGLKDEVPEKVGHKNFLSQQLEIAGISEDLACEVAKELNDLEEGNVVKSLLDLQLLLFNMKSMASELSVLEKSMHGGYQYTQVRLLDNLHLAFPTIHKTNNTDEGTKSRDLFFTKKNVDFILGSPALSQFMRLAIRHNMSKFLGLRISEGTISFDDTPMTLFNQKDPKKTDFAKVCSRVMQVAVLFDVFKETTQVKACVDKIRESYPVLGILSDGKDMILGSLEMQLICSEKKLDPNILCVNSKQQVEKKVIPGLVPLTEFGDPLKGLDIFEPAETLLSKLSIDHVLEYLKTNGLFSPDEGLKKAVFYHFQEYDPVGFEKNMMSVLQIVSILTDKGSQDLFQDMLDICRRVDTEMIESLAFNDGADKAKKAIVHGHCDVSEFSLGITDKSYLTFKRRELSTEQCIVYRYHDKRPDIIQFVVGRFDTKGSFVVADKELTLKKARELASKTSFGLAADGSDLLGINSKASSKVEWLKVVVGGASPKTEYPFSRPKKETKVEKVVRRGGGISAVETDVIHEAEARLVPMESIRERVASIVPTFSNGTPQYDTAKALGLYNETDTPLWKVVPEFHGGDLGKPKRPYIETADIIGDCHVELLSGPAFFPEVLKSDQDSFQCHVFDPRVKKDTRLLTHTLGYTVDGDAQVLRPNGLQYSKAAVVPMGGNIEFNGGNEKHRFRSNDARRFFKNTAKGQGYSGMGAYTEVDLAMVEDYDKELLSDTERRLKRAKMISSAYITVTARGGYGSERVPLESERRVLFINTAGPQFEKYGNEEFQYQDESKVPNELEASDFIIKTSASENTSPLFPEYYESKKIESYDRASLGSVCDLSCPTKDQAYFTTHKYVKLSDGALFNRRAYQMANDHYLGNVVDVINERLTNNPFYLKATLYGGGFFAKTKAGDDLRTEVVHTMVLSYLTHIQKASFPEGSVIEFPRYGRQEDLPTELITSLMASAKEKGLKIVWNTTGDVFDFDEQTSLESETIAPSSFESSGRMVVLNAGDAMSWCGNERSSASVEAMIGNNTNARVVMNWWANPKVLDK